MRKINFSILMSCIIILLTAFSCQEQPEDLPCYPVPKVRLDFDPDPFTSLGYWAPYKNVDGLYSPSIPLEDQPYSYKARKGQYYPVETSRDGVFMWSFLIPPRTYLRILVEGKPVWVPENAGTWCTPP